MKKGIRRQQQQRAKRRWLVILYGRASGPSFRAFTEQSDYFPDLSWLERPWRNCRYKLQNEPNWHTHIYQIRPMRAQANHFARLITKGMDSDIVQWPDGKKPHAYYW